MRRILRDRPAGVLVALLAYILLLQGLLSAFAQGALAKPQPGASFVICSQTGAVAGTEGIAREAPLERAAHHCCAALCHTATSHGPIIPAGDPGPAPVPETGMQAFIPSPAVRLRPSTLGLSAEARAPPPYSI